MAATTERKSIPTQVLIGVMVAIAFVIVWIAFSFVGVRMNNSQYIAIICVLWAVMQAAIGMRSIAGAVALFVVFFGLYYVIASHGFHVVL